MQLPSGPREAARIGRAPLLEGPYDLAIVGGGINGAALARDVVMRGKSVILLEKGDLGEGTSSRSSKMIHGGIRYLEQLRLGLVYESIRERKLLLGLAPHLVRPQSFVLPLYRGAPRGPRLVRLGLFLYDALATGRKLGRSRFLTAGAVHQRVQPLLIEGLEGGGVYFDAVMDDARLVLANALGALEEASRRGVPCALRPRTEVLSVSAGSPSRVRVRDRLGGGDEEVLAHDVVRAVGPWSDPSRLVPSKGAHIVLPRLPFDDGLLLTHSQDGRVFFVIPWLGMTIVGTTETPWDRPPDEVRVEKEDIDYLLGELERVLPGIRIGRGDILGAFAGVRPLARGGASLRRGAPGRVSRVHALHRDGDGAWCLYGGKYTTYRAVAADVLGRIYPGTACDTASAPLPGGEEGGWDAFRSRAPDVIEALGAGEAERLFQRYGCRLREVAALVREDPSSAEPVAPGAAISGAEVVHCARRELALYPEDVLARRTTARYGRDGGRGAYDAVEAILRRERAETPPDLDAARGRYFEDLEREDALRLG